MSQQHKLFLLLETLLYWFLEVKVLFESKIRLYNAHTRPPGPPHTPQRDSRSFEINLRYPFLRLEKAVFEISDFNRVTNVKSMRFISCIEFQKKLAMSFRGNQTLRTQFSEVNMCMKIAKSHQETV